MSRAGYRRVTARRRGRWTHVCVAALALAGVAAAQQQIVGGYALDANPRVGSSGFNQLSTRGLSAPTYGSWSGRRSQTNWSRTGTVQIDNQYYDAVRTRSGVALSNSGNALFGSTYVQPQLGAVVPRLDAGGGVQTTTFYASSYNPLR